MGFFDRFAKKGDVDAHTEIIHTRFSNLKHAVKQSFSDIKKDIDTQKKWVVYLNNVHRWLSHAHDKHRSLAKKDMEQLKRWIAHLNDNSRRHEAAMKTLEKNLKETAIVNHKHMTQLYKKLNMMSEREHRIREEIMSEADQLIKKKHEEAAKLIQDRHEEATRLIQNKHEEAARLIDDRHGEAANMIEAKHGDATRMIEAKHAEAARLIEAKHGEAAGLIEGKHEEAAKMIHGKLEEATKMIQDKHGEAMSHIEKITEDIKKLTMEKPLQPPPGGLTSPEQKLLNLMVSESDPVSYSHIAEKTGNSINTVRVIMNNLKKRGLVEEQVLPSGVKLFSATNKEKIKKLYNIRHL